MTLTSGKPEPTAAQKNQLWKSGYNFYQLHSSQLQAYKQIRAWQADSLEKRKRGEQLPGLYPRVFIIDSSRRWGKDWLCLSLADEDCRRRPKQVITYATSTQKDVNEIVLPLLERILEDCPESLRPVYRTSHQGTTNGFYYPNGSVLKLVGIDARPDSLRGRFSDGFYFSEGAFVSRLQEALQRVVLPQLQGRLHASIIMNSTPPVEPATFWDVELCPDAALHGRYVKRTIFDNPLLSDAERTEFINAAGGLDSENCRREYLVERIRSATATVVPEFSRERHVEDVPNPQFALGFSVLDPAVRDLCAIATGWFDFEDARMVIRRSWAKRNANTNEVAAALRHLEEQTFKELHYWQNGKGFCNNPWLRFSDTEARLILDLNTQHGIKVVNVDKSQGKEAALHSFRSAVQTGKIVWHPDAEEAIAHVEAAVWNRERSGWARTDVHGHFDLLDVAIYAWLSANKIENPFPPRGVVMSQQHSVDSLHLPKHTLERKRKLAGVWNEVFGATRRFRTKGR